MKKIVFNTPGAMLIAGKNGEVTRTPIVGKAELPYSESNLDYVRRVALDGAYEILEDSEPEAKDAADELNALLEGQA